MHAIYSERPSKHLSPFVRQYAQREVSILATITIEPVPARNEPILEFQFGEPYEIRHSRTDCIEIAPRVVIVGLQTWARVKLLIGGNINAFVIVFEPLGFYRLLGAYGIDLVNQAQDAAVVLGNSMTLLWEQLAEAKTFALRIEIVEDFLTRRLRATETTDLISSVAAQIVGSEGRLRIGDLARDCGISVRQMERKFLAQIGITPKAYARIARFGMALRSKASQPAHSWAEIAHQMGYHDQMHMVHDFHELSGESPSKIMHEVDMIYQMNFGPPKARDQVQAGI